ncbi:MAG TPA: aminotransferase class V-fold PLP-dependent enzyme [Candidatus Omnitrophica bacterium]|nr:aminotransferase class V-fold PLP-dependent enzyme [Candidatus Omnitrophota bacterium]
MIPQLRATGTKEENTNFSPYILSISLPPLPGEVTVRSLSEMGICISTGSACSSRKKDRMRTLINMGIPEDIADSAIRISYGWYTTKNELEEFLEGIKKLEKLIPRKNRKFLSR